ncbi:hypothetical protein KHA80_08840 [Anaerobacillus sp. HL2]|nr:hypothetical protein KHA80_08840 [Anaerobacillus sp. HL2]
MPDCSRNNLEMLSLKNTQQIRLLNQCCFITIGGMNQMIFVGNKQSKQSDTK